MALVTVLVVDWRRLGLAAAGLGVDVALEDDNGLLADGAAVPDGELIGLAAVV
jgi:hypothetical protein